MNLNSKSVKRFIWDLAGSLWTLDISWHGGNTGGQSAFVGFDRETKNVVAVLLNSMSVQTPEQLLGFALFRALNGEEPGPLGLPPTINLSNATLDHYVGTYKTTIDNKDLLMQIKRKDNALYFVFNSDEYRMYAQKEDEFYLRIAPVLITFKKGNADSYDTMIFHQEGMKELTLTRVP